MSLPSAARVALECLKSEFETGSTTRPQLRHVLIATPDIEAFGEADIESSMLFRDRRIQPLWREPTETQIFVDEDGFPDGRIAYEAFRKLAMSTVKILTAQKLFEPDESPPDHSGGWCAEEKENHYAREWMRFIHRYAEAHPGAWPDSESTTYLEHRQLRKGGIVKTLTPGVFKASSMTIKRILEDVANQAPEAVSSSTEPPAGLRRPEAGEPTAVGNPASEHDPFVVRAPNGFLFAYGDLDAAAKIDVDAMAIDPVAEARRVDPMPDPEKITLGEMIDFVTFIARVSQEFRDLLATPEIGQQYNRRETVLSASPGWKAFKHWQDIEHHRKTPLEAAKELLALLVDRMRRPSDELRLMPLLDAVRLVSQPDAASAPAPPREDKTVALRAERPDGGRVAFYPEKCIEYPVCSDSASVVTLYFDPSDQRVIICERLWSVSAKNNAPHRPNLIDGQCRIVTFEEAREALRRAGKTIPTELDVASPPPRESEKPTDASGTEALGMELARPFKACPQCGKRFPPLTPICDVCRKPMPITIEELTRDAPAANWFRLDPSTTTPAVESQHVDSLTAREDEKPAAAPASGSSAKSSSSTQRKPTRRPKRISKVQTALVILKYRASKERESIRVEDIAAEAACSPQNLYKSPVFQKEWGLVRARRIRRGWKVEGVADCPDESTLDVG